MKFFNRPNACATLSDGQDIWLARDIAVAFTIVFIHQKVPYVLINKRGPGVPNFQGFWNLPCGYLDYDETIPEGAIREVWEECGVNITPFIKTGEIQYVETPWAINSTPNGSKQNVTIHHGLLATVNELPEVSNANNEPNETSDICWLPLSKLYTLEFAFDHQQRIQQFVTVLDGQSTFNFCEHLS